MIIKQAASRNHDLEALNALLSSPQVDRLTKNKIIREIKNIQSGLQGEKEAAYQMNFHYADSKNWMIIHDLRIEHQGQVAQIDHLILNRCMEIYVCESKRFSEGISINEHGEFSAYYQGKPYGIPSPIEQNNLHIALLKKIFNSGQIDLPVRLGFKMKPRLISLILVANTARITRPSNAKNIPGLDRIIKNEQLYKQIHKDIEGETVLTTAKSMVKLISSETVQSFAQSLADLHQPLTINWPARFGIEPLPEPATALPSPVITPPQAPEKSDSSPRSAAPTRLFCAACKKTVTPKVASYCWNNKPRFQGKVYCYHCQKNV